MLLILYTSFNSSRYSLNLVSLHMIQLFTFKLLRYERPHPRVSNAMLEIRDFESQIQ